jgi:unsaturated rhamnogalacturonyl hydrolase
MQKDLLQYIARRTMEYPFKVWGFGEGTALEALWEAGGRLKVPEYRDFVIDRFEQWLRREPRLVEADHSAPGSLLLTTYEASGDERYLSLAHDLAEYMIALPQASTKARFHRPQHPDYSSYIYVDCMEVDAPFFCHLAAVTGDNTYYDFAAEQLLGYTALLLDDEAGLFYHQYDGQTQQVNGTFWGRGNGWALLGLLKTLKRLPETHSTYAKIAGLYTRLADSLVRLQHADGAWSTVLDQPETYREASLSALFGYGVREGIAAGLLPQSYVSAAERAWDAVLRTLTADGLLEGVSVATPPGDAPHYNQIATGAGFPWGQGPALLLALNV